MQKSFHLQITFLTVFPLEQGVAEIPLAFSVHCTIETQKDVTIIYLFVVYHVSKPQCSNNNKSLVRSFLSLLQLELFMHIKLNLNY